MFQESLDVMSTNDDNTLGFTLELYSRYMEASRVGNISNTIGNYFLPVIKGAVSRGNLPF